MKKFALLLVLFLIGTFSAVQAQNKTTYDKAIDSEEVLLQYRAKAVDTVSANKETFTYTIYNEGQADLKESFLSRWQIALDSVSGTATGVKVEFQKRPNIFTTWTTDSTMYFYGTTSDSTLIMNDASASPDPYRRVKVTHGS